MAPTEMVLKKTMQLFVFFGIISYIVNTGNLKSYYIQPGRTTGYKINVNFPTKRPEIRLCRIGSFVRTSTLDMGSHPRGQPRTTRSPQVPGNFHVSTHSATAQPQSPDMTHLVHKLVFGEKQLMQTVVWLFYGGFGAVASSLLRRQNVSPS
ncbi:endoplasmic reticulum-Golgi intermediate compartment protein 1-like [Salvelinus fontinalis]|uniref:endoplasmic reticulum-Golgi intermediate compartment protein 1-like n=1 Tax=Salvelinus fontinalis TaxID=8038 RepID=UPI002484E24E|nr:endoplasmic reticulum-Golgi intermediate compartment protein 1-like [Salvelinus fontinalis]